MAENKKKITSAPTKVLYEDKPSHLLAYLLVLVIVIALFGGAYWSWKNYFQEKFQTPGPGITINVPAPPIDIKLPDREVTINLDDLMIKSPESVVEGFYDWYIGYSGNPLEDKAYATQPAITDILAEKMEKLSEGSTMDPFLCAQSKPNSFTVSPAEMVGGSAATVLVNENFNGSTVQVKINLRLSNNAWQMTNIQCVPQNSLTAFLDLLRDETGIPFSAPQPLTFSWSIPDDKGSESISVQGSGVHANGVVIHPDALVTFFRVQGFDMDPLSLDTGKDGYQKGNVVCLVEDIFDKSAKHDVSVNCGEL